VRLTSAAITKYISPASIGKRKAVKKEKFILSPKEKF
jgi:hypothetical protein